MHYITIIFGHMNKNLSPGYPIPYDCKVVRSGVQNENDNYFTRDRGLHDCVDSDRGIRLGVQSTRYDRCFGLGIT
jgi:hypothetical protein